MEYIDVVDDQDRVVSKVSRQEIYKNLLTHRIVHVLVLNSSGEMAIQLRSKTVPYLPLHWSTSAGGHVASGETCEVAAQRELKEECGIDAEPEFMFKEIYYHENKLKKFLSVFKVVYDQSIMIKNDEVDKVEFFSINKIKQMIVDGEKMHPELTFIIKNHF